MISKGTMQQTKKILGYIVGAVGIALIFVKEATLFFITSTGFFLGSVYLSILPILLLITSYFLVIAGRRN